MVTGRVRMWFPGSSSDLLIAESKSSPNSSVGQRPPQEVTDVLILLVNRGDRSDKHKHLQDQ